MHFNFKMSERQYPISFYFTTYLKYALTFKHVRNPFRVNRAIYVYVLFKCFVLGLSFCFVHTLKLYQSCSAVTTNVNQYLPPKANADQAICFILRTESIMVKS